jgi:CxxC motif-containing protein (DUF1111 family)
MLSLALIDRMLRRTVVRLACSTLGLGSLALIAVVSVGMDTTPPANGAAPPPPTEAPTGFDNVTNGFTDPATFDKDREEFEQVETILPDPTLPKDEAGGGLGPVYNATSCVSCHQNPVTGSSSQIAELRAGHREPDPTDPSPQKVKFVEAPGGSLIHQRAIDAAIQEHVRPEDDVRTLRMSTNILGNGFVEVIPDEDILYFRRDKQPEGMKGLPIARPVAVRGTKGSDDKSFEFESVERLGRFGWKCQEASLVNFSAGAYINEMGITSPLQPEENTSSGADVSAFDKVPELEDEDDGADPEHPFGEDVKAFARFMRSTKAPPRDASPASATDVQAGETLFRNNALLGCAICHRPDYITPPAGTPIKPLDSYSTKPGSDLGTVPPALGNKIIHPYSDFMLHDIGTGDGIAQTQQAQRPPRGVANLERLPDAIMTREGIMRVEARPQAGNRRTLSAVSAAVPELDQRTVNMIRTAPLWGLRVRPQLMHDGLSLTLDDAIRRHKGQAEGVRLKYEALSDAQKQQLIAFLNSL